MAFFEGIGMVRQLMGSQRQVVDTYAFDAWGNELTTPQSPIPNPFRYVGKHGYYLDTESALMLLGVRYYSANIGRFISLDPFIQLINRFSYSNNNPVNGLDPLGLWCIKIPDSIPILGGKCFGNTCHLRPDCPQYKGPRPKPIPPSVPLPIPPLPRDPVPPPELEIPVPPLPPLHPPTYPHLPQPNIDCLDLCQKHFPNPAKEDDFPERFCKAAKPQPPFSADPEKTGELGLETFCHIACFAACQTVEWDQTTIGEFLRDFLKRHPKCSSVFKP